MGETGSIDSKSDAGSATLEVNQTAAGLVFLHKNLVESLPWFMLIPVVLAIAFSGVDEWSGILVWGGVFYLIFIPRYFLSRRFIKKQLPSNDRELLHWRLWVIGPTLVSGVLWGISPFVFFELGADYQQVVFLTILNGVCLMSVLLATYCLPACIGFLLPAMSGEFLFFIFSDDSRYRVIALLPLLLSVVLIKIAQNTRAQTQKSERLKVENQKLVANLIREKDRAEAANRAKTQFLAAANHDLRQPVHSLTLLAEALKSDTSDPETAKLVSYIGDSVESLDFVLTALLDISRLEAEVVKVNKMPVRLQPLLHALYLELLPIAVAKNIKLRLHVRDYTVHTDPLHLSKILRNLIKNAIQFTNEGGVLLGVRRKGTQVAFQVWDTGEGIPNNELENVFTEFYQRNNPSRENGKGLGLGLSISRRLTGLLDHKLSLKSQCGKGTVFELALPWLEPERIIDVSAHTKSIHPLIGRRILVVDNDVNVVKSTSAVLQKWGCVVATAGSFEEAVLLLEDGNCYDLYLVDYMLGSRYNGVELLERLKQFDGGEVAGIIMTGNTEPEFLRKTTDAGHILLHKPVKPAALRALVSGSASKGSIANRSHTITES